MYRYVPYREPRLALTKRGGCEAANEDTPLPRGHRLRGVRGLPAEEERGAGGRGEREGGRAAHVALLRVRVMVMVRVRVRVRVRVMVRVMVRA